jgi:hypothetical protein
MVLAFFSFSFPYAKVDRLMYMKPKKKKKKCSRKKDLNFYFVLFGKFLGMDPIPSLLISVLIRPFFFFHWLKCLSSLFLVR